MTMKEIFNIELSDLKSMIVTCKKCKMRMTFDVKTLAKMEHLVCGACNTRLGQTISDFYLGKFAQDLLRESNTVDIGFELTKE